MMTLVYGKHNINDRKALREGLLKIGMSITEPWCIWVDFNTPLMHSDRVGGNEFVEAKIVGDHKVVESETKDFQY